MGEEGLELLGRSVAFLGRSQGDEILNRFADQRMVVEMKKVFFGDSNNSLGHSYAKLITGPEGRHDLQDVIALLEREPATKRALITLSPQPGGKVPCVNAAQFLVRDHSVCTMYFARGQDVFRKFYADALCLVTMAETIGAKLRLPAGLVRGFIGSAHVYHHDLPSIRDTLATAKNASPSGRQEGVAA